VSITGLYTLEPGKPVTVQIKKGRWPAGHHPGPTQHDARADRLVPRGLRAERRSGHRSEDRRAGEDGRSASRARRYQGKARKKGRSNGRQGPDPEGRQGHYRPRQAARAGQPDHRLHRGRRDGTRHLGGRRPRARRRGGAGLSGHEEDRLGRGVRGREGRQGLRQGLPAEPACPTRRSTSSASIWWPSRARSPHPSARASARST